MRFDRAKFYEGFRRWRGEITSQQVRGLNFLLDAVEMDRFVQRIDWFAYMLATTMIETAYTFLPIHEYGSRAYFIRRYGSQTRVGRQLGNDTPEEGAIYAGRGDVQLTGESNYEKAEIALRREYPALIADFERRTGKRFDLTVGDQPNDIDDPNNAQDPQIAYAIMSYGMRTGMFTGRKLSDYFNSSRKDAFNARKIINGLDNAQKFASAFEKFEQILKNSLIKENEFQNTSDARVILPTEKDVQNENIEQSDTTKVEVKDGDVKVETSTTPLTEPEKIAIEKPESKNFFRILWTEITGLTAGNFTLQGIREYFEQAQLFGLSAKFWFWVTAFAVGASVIYLIMRFLKYREETKRDLEITNKLIDTNSTQTNIVELVDKDEISLKEQKGYKIVRR